MQERMERELVARQQGIEENLETALQCYPEHFAPIAMLYIPCEINGVKMRAFVDSGAQVPPDTHSADVDTRHATPA